MVVILMGVSGAGKTAVGNRLAARLGWPFHDGDDLHPSESVRKMSTGVPLTDADRRPWLESIHDLVLRLEAEGRSAVIACSALKEAYRRLLLDGTRQTRLVYLYGEPALIEGRLRERRGHFFDANLLLSQFAALEEPSDAIVIDVDADLDSVTASASAALGLEKGESSKEEGEH